MALALSSLPLDLLASILTHARCNISDIINWRMVSRAFRHACMQILHLEKEAIYYRESDILHLDGIYANVNEFGQSSTFKVILKMCPGLQRIDWLPVFGKGVRWNMTDMCSQINSCCLNLTHLSLSHCTMPQSALDILQTMQYLQVLSLIYVTLSDNGMDPDPWIGFPQLRCLDLSWFKGLQPVHLSILGPQLLSLSVHGCEPVRDLLCAQLANCISLDICCTSIGDEGLRILAEEAPRLRSLFVSHRYRNTWSDPAWTDRGLGELQSRRPTLVVRQVASLIEKIDAVLADPAVNSHGLLRLHSAELPVEQNI